MNPTLNGSFALQRFKRGNMVEIRNGIMSDFYPGRPHMQPITFKKTGSFVHLIIIKRVSIFSGSYDTYKALMLVVRAGWDVNQWRVW